MLIEEIVEDEGELCTEGRILWISNNRGSSQGNMIQVLNGVFFGSIGV